MGGCLPLLIQMPIFILLYSALISPQFIQVAGDQHFLFIKSLATNYESYSREYPRMGHWGAAKRR